MQNNRKKLLDILPNDFRWRGVWVAFTLLLRACLNLVGLAILIPILVLVLDPSSLQGEGKLAQYYALSGLDSPTHFALVICGAVVVVIALKCAINLGLAVFERRYIYALYRTLSRRLYIAYHERGLGFIKRSNSAVLARNVNVVCLQFTAGVLRPLALIVAEALFFLLLFATLLIYSPTASLLAVAVFLPAIWLYYGLVRNRINRYGELENRAQREKARVVSETFRGYADIEINAAFGQMLRTFDRAMDEVIHTRLKESALGLLPTAFTEIGVAIGMALLVTIGMGSGESLQLLFGLFAVAALRLMPSIRSILGAWSTLRYNQYTIEVLHDTLEHLPEEASQPTQERLSFEQGIEVRDLYFQFEDGDEELFHGLNLSIKKGEKVGIQGVSGTGKTTLFNLLLGLYQPTRGAICIDGEPLTPSNRRAWQNRIGYVSQNLFLVDGTFAENVALGTTSEEIDRERVAKAWQQAQLGDFIAGLAQGVDTPIGECGCRLSGGQRQRIGIARALYRNSDLLFFDEATSALDSQTEEEINRSIASLAASQKGLTLVVIAHRDSSLEYCDRIITLER